jgi:AraC-like DNA-binding protein
LAKIAVDYKATLTSHVVAKGDAWAVSDVVCAAGPHDRPFEERHTGPTIAIVIGGTFQYRSRNGCELMTPGSLLLGSAGQAFECGHQHDTGDRCISFSYSQEFFERLAADMGAGTAGPAFKTLRLPPVRFLSPWIARASAALAGSAGIDWEELTVQLARQALRLDRGLPPVQAEPEPSAIARVTRAVRIIERHPEAGHRLGSLAREARLSPYHFLRTFERLTGVTPHQYLLRVRLKQAAIRIETESTRILDIALDCGFGDVSNFTRTFRAEFGVSPRQWGRIHPPALHRPAATI